MTTDGSLGVVLALASACCYALAATLQHGSVSAVARGERLTVRHLRRVLTRRRWLLGMLGTACGGALHAVALSCAALVVVQPVSVLAIGLTALLASGRTRPDRPTVRGVLLTTLGVTGFVLIAAHGSHEAPAPPDPPLGVQLLCAAAVLVLVVAARGARGRLRCAVFGCAAGTAYATVSLLTRSLTAGVRVDGWGGLHLAPSLGVVVGVVTGLWCVQQAYAAGRPDTAVACQSVTDPVVAVLLGSWIYAETAGWSAGALVGALCCGAVAVLGVVLLARRGRVPPTRNERLVRAHGRHERVVRSAGEEDALDGLIDGVVVTGGRSRGAARRRPAAWPR